MTRAVWVERLGLFDLLRLLPESLLPGTSVYYDARRSGGTTQRVLGLLRSWGLAASLKPADLTLAAHEPDGSALNYRFEDTLEHVAGSYLKGADPSLAGRDLQVAKCWLSSHLFFRVTFITMAERAAEAAGAAENVLHLAGHPANAALFAHYRRPGFRLRQSVPLRGFLKAFLTPVAVALMSLVPRRTKASFAPGRPSVWVEYYPADLDGFISRAFWRPHLDASGRELVFLIDRPDTPDAEAEGAEIRKRGFQWVELRRAWQGARLTASEAARALARAVRAPAPRLLSWFRLERELETELWTRVYRRWNVRVLIQHQEFSWKQAAQADALERAGGALVGVHWSYFPYLTEAGHLSPHHAYFVWGDAGREWLEGKGHSVRRVLPCGVWIGDNRGGEDPAAGLRAGTRFRIGVFDSSYDYNIYLSASQLASFLGTVLGLLEEHPDWGAVLKPKTFARYSDLPGGPALVARVTALRSSGRLVIGDRTLSPVGVARSVDLCVCYGFNSAGILAGTMGGRAVHWDCSGWTRHPFYRDPSQRFLFRDLSALRDAVVAAAAGDASVGDFSRYRRWMNAFEDERAPERVAGWLDDFLRRVEGGTPALAAVDGASDAYEKRHRIR